MTEAADDQKESVETRPQRLAVLTAAHGGFFFWFANKAASVGENIGPSSIPALLWCALFMGTGAYGLFRCFFAWRALHDGQPKQFQRSERIALKWAASMIMTAVGLVVAFAISRAVGLPLITPS